MKATGIIRRVDDLGRVVIPREIRRTLGIKENDPMEIYTDNDGGVTFRKYKAETENIADECVKIVNQAFAQKTILHLFVDDDGVTVITPKGKATTKRNSEDSSDINVDACAALTKLGYCKMPDGLHGLN